MHPTGYTLNHRMYGNGMYGRGGQQVLLYVESAGQEEKNETNSVKETERDERKKKRKV